MRAYKRNQQSLKVAYLIGKTDVYVTDKSGNVKYIEVDGELKPVTDGQKELIYENPIDFNATISFGGSESDVKAYGIDMSAYESVLTYKKGENNLKEGALIWYKSEPRYKYADNVEITYKQNTYITKAPESKSADFMVVKVIPSLNEERVILNKVTRNE